MMTLLNLYSSSIDTWNISYMLAPRINAAGRIAEPRIAVELLLCEDEARALNWLQLLKRLIERQSLEASYLKRQNSNRK